MNDRSYLSYRATQLVSRALPRRFAYWLGLRIADRFFARDRAGRQAIMSNFAHILRSQNIKPSDETLRQMTRKNFQMFGKYIVDFFKFSELQSGDIGRMVSLEHFEHLEHAESLGRGVIMITAHLGNWEFGGAVLAAMGRAPHVVFQPLGSNKINKLFQKHRENRGMRVIPMGRAARGIIRALRRKEIVAMLADRDYTSNHEKISFFGAPARLPSGPARLAAITGAPLVPAFLLRQPDDTFLLKMHQPIIPGKDVRVDDIRFAIRDVIEMEIARNPLQWFMFEDFWSGANHQ